MQRSALEPRSPSEEAFRILVDGVLDHSIFMLDPTGIITTWNVGAERMSGFRASEVIGQHFSVLYPAAARNAGHPDEELRRAAEVGRYHEEGLRRRKDDTEYWASISLSALRDADGTLRGFAKVTQDISDRKKAEQKLLESEERLRLLVESVRDYAIFLLDPDGIIASWNSGAEKLKGYRESEIIGQHFSVFYPEDLRAIHHPEHELKLAAQFGRYEEEGIRVRKDGTVFHANVVITALFDRTRKLRGFAKVTRDITDRKLAEQSLRQAKEQLEHKVAERTLELEAAKNAAEEANRAKTTFLANMSHEIRTPLNAVVGFSEILAEEDQTPEELAEAKDAIIRNGRLLVSLIDDILDFAKVEAGQIKIRKESVALQHFLAQVAATCNLQAQEKGLAFTISAEGTLPETVETDPVRLKQILFNVIGNATKFTERGSVAVAVRSTTAASGTFLSFSVHDTGPGIAAESHGRLFAPFSQVDESLTRRHGGSGLGLALSRRLARDLGGDLQLGRSAPGEGSTFVVVVDAGAKMSVLFDSSTRKSTLPTVDDVMSAPTLIGLRVLVVEDLDDNRNLVRRYLKRSGAIVEFARNGLEGISKTAEAAFDLVLMDLSMPVMDGYQATIELRKRGFKQPIVALTAHALSEDRRRCSDLGFTDFIAKPIDPIALVTTIRRLVP